MALQLFGHKTRLLGRPSGGHQMGSRAVSKSQNGQLNGLTAKNNWSPRGHFLRRSLQMLFDLEIFAKFLPNFVLYR